MAKSYIDDRVRPTRDVKTGKDYPTRKAAYQALAEGEGLSLRDRVGWYKLCRRHPGRFQDVFTGRMIDSQGKLVGGPAAWGDEPKC